MEAIGKKSTYLLQKQSEHQQQKNSTAEKQTKSRPDLSKEKKNEFKATSSADQSVKKVNQEEKGTVSSKLAAAKLWLTRNNYRDLKLMLTPVVEISLCKLTLLIAAGNEDEMKNNQVKEDGGAENGVSEQNQGQEVKKVFSQMDAYYVQLREEMKLWNLEKVDSGNPLYNICVLWDPKIHEKLRYHDNEGKHLVYTDFAIGELFSDAVIHFNPNMDWKKDFILLEIVDNKIEYLAEGDVVIRVAERTAYMNATIPVSSRKLNLFIERDTMEDVAKEMVRSYPVPTSVMIWGAKKRHLENPYKAGSDTIVGRIDLRSNTSPHIIIFRSEEISMERMELITSKLSESEFHAFSHRNHFRVHMHKNDLTSHFSCHFMKRDSVMLEMLYKRKKTEPSVPKVFGTCRHKTSDNNKDSTADSTFEKKSHADPVRALFHTQQVMNDVELQNGSRKAPPPIPNSIVSVGPSEQEVDPVNVNEVQGNRLRKLDEVKESAS